MSRAAARRGVREAVLTWLGFAAIVFVAGGSLLVTSFALDLQVAATNYVTGESYWSKARSEAVRALYAYTATGDRRHWVRARAALAVPLGDRRARLALERDPPDREAARAGFLAGDNAPEDVPRMIDFYLRFSEVGHFSRAVDVWREADRYILELAEITDQIARTHEGPATPSPRSLTALRTKVEDIAERVRVLERSFAEHLADGVRWLRAVLNVVTVASFGVLALVAGAMVAWSVRRVRESDLSVRKTFEQAGVGMARVDATGRLLDANEALCELVGRSRAALVGASLIELIHPEDRPRADEGAAFLAPMEGTTHEFRLLDRSGGATWIRSTLSEIELGGHRARQLFATFEDVSEAKRLTDELAYQARHDMLTGLVNRYEFERRVDEARASAERYDVTHSLCFLDLDQFKIVNDTSGHAAGDALLGEIATVLTSSLRATDTVGRLGGDEFGVILDRTPPNTAIEVADKLRTTIEESDVLFQGRRFRTGCSIGVTAIRGDDAGAGVILRRGDVACYMAKELGRNRVHAYAESDEAQAARQGEMEWVDRIRNALDEDRFQLYAQRIVGLDDAAESRYELLLRLLDRDGQLHAPAVFLPAAERYGLIGEIDRWVVRTVLATMAHRPAAAASLGICHVNVSARSVSDPTFLNDLLVTLDGAGVPPERLCVEITETAAMSSLAEARRFLSTLGARGVNVALDDFGSGLSSFAYLKTLDVDLVKIDGMLVRDVVDNPLDRTLVRSVHDLARVLGKRTVAEFVESGATLEIVREIGVDYVQGYALHRPCPWPELLGEPRT